MKEDKITLLEKKIELLLQKARSLKEENNALKKQGGSTNGIHKEELRKRIEDVLSKIEKLED